MKAKTLNDRAVELINDIASDLDGDETELKRILDALEDGEALAYMGCTDDDQIMVEEAHTIVAGWIEEGRHMLSHVRAGVE